MQDRSHQLHAKFHLDPEDVWSFTYLPVVDFSGVLPPKSVGNVPYRW